MNWRNCTESRARCPRALATLDAESPGSELLCEDAWRGATGIENENSLPLQVVEGAQDCVGVALRGGGAHAEPGPVPG